MVERKKAQKEKDRFRNTVAQVVSEGTAKKTFLNRRFAKGLVFILTAIICLSCVYLWWGTKTSGKQDDQPRIESPLPEKKKPENKKKVVPFDYVGLSEEAKVSIKNREFNKARAIYRKILNKDPGDVEILNNLAVVYMSEKAYFSAQKLLEKAVRLRPSYLDPTYNLACLYAMKGEVSASIHYLKKALSLDPVAGDWAKKDQDFMSLKGISEFEKLINRVDNEK